MANDFLKRVTPYDFMFKRGSSALYCFELAKECYPNLDVRTVEKTAFFGVFKKDVVLSESFFNSKDFKLIFEYNPKFYIDFISSNQSL